MELGLKLIRESDGLTSDVHVAKDRVDPRFLSQETEDMFILTARLKGYNRGNIKIDINEDGTLIAVNGERRVKETVIIGWNVYNKDTEVKGFKRAFGIPKGVILDKIKAKFNEDESSLTITMPKKVKGILGKVIEEIKEKEEIVEENLLHQENDEKSGAKKGEEIPEEVKEVGKCVSGYTENDAKVHNFEVGEKGHGASADEKPFQGPKNDQVLDHGESSGTKELEKQDQKENEDENVNSIHGEEKETSVVETSEESRDYEPDRVEEDEQKNWAERLKICAPIVAGSALLVSFVVFVIQIVRNQNRRKD
ncbi:hypothetical protein BUALT_Bualt01G0018300 [Buddleja alternifolia]|uniref:SHSP domain-containing protein n=1 Tax=Buddleja alternifolia TaxID=168488 RepID=A0AAV6YAE6_9LAMI|nr:hypothetical protein BUALT_Bualt01G0018300 [Buddleja alternifolia]